MKQLNPAKIKNKIMDIGLETGASHVASAMSCVDLLCNIYNKPSLKDAIVILSKGHGALALYVILNELGKLPRKVLETYYKDGGLSVHSTLNKKYGIMASTGSLGHGLAIGIGYAIGNPDKPVIVILGDGEMEEGSTLEAFQLINRLGISNIMPIVDRNDLQGFKKAEPMTAPKFGEYFSIKGEGFGEEFENNISSHYQVISTKIYKNWIKNGPRIERERLKLLELYKNARKPNGQTKS